MANEVGFFQRGISLDIPAVSDLEKVEEKAKTNFEKKMSNMLQQAKEKNAAIDDKSIKLSSEERKKRIGDALLALSDMDGGAKKSLYLTDVSPKFVIGAVLNVANHVFMDTLKTEDGKVFANIDAVKEIVKDYKQNFLSPIFIGIRKGFITDTHYEELSKLQLDLIGLII
jgi:CRISPR-associated protein Cst2